MEGGGGLQVADNNLTGATRFKTMGAAQLVRTRCPRTGCGRPDSWEHFLDCYEVPDVGCLEREDRINSRVQLCKKIRIPNQIRPDPWEQKVEGPRRKKWAGADLGVPALD